MIGTSALRTLPQLLLARVTETPDAEAFALETAPGRWEPVSWKVFAAQVSSVQAGLSRQGVVPGMRLAIIAPVSLEWELVHHAALAIGATVIGLDAHDTPARLQSLLDQAEVEALAVAGTGVLPALSAERRRRLKALVYWGEDKPDEGLWPLAQPLTQLMSGAATETPPQATEPQTGDPQAHAPQPHDLATIIFTSGTTGTPKGIAYTHQQMCLAIEAICEGFPFVGPGSHLLCWLPLSNLFQRVVNLAGMRSGALSFLLSDPRRVMDVVAQVSPDVFVGVPRFYEKLYQGLRQRITVLPPLQRRALEWAWRVGRSTSMGRRPGGHLSHWAQWQWRLADRLVLQRVRALTGTRLRCFISGSAPTPRALLEELHGLGWTVLEAYGLSENVVPMALNRLDDFRFGSVGRPVQGQRVTCQDGGAVCVEGPGVFSGYLGQPPRQPGAYSTGDLGHFDAEGYLHLTGRSGDLFKTSTGRRVAPAGIEAQLATCAGVDQVMLVGAGRKYLVALLHPLPGWWPERQTELATLLARSLSALNESDRPVAFGVMRRPFSVECGELTPNLKLRRQAIEVGHAAAIEALYTALESPAADRLQAGHGPRLVALG